jgi:hypothetical protein
MRFRQDHSSIRTSSPAENSFSILIACSDESARVVDSYKKVELLVRSDCDQVSRHAIEFEFSDNPQSMPYVAEPSPHVPITIECVSYVADQSKDRMKKLHKKLRLHMKIAVIKQEVKVYRSIRRLMRSSRTHTQ